MSVLTFTPYGIYVAQCLNGNCAFRIIEEHLSVIFVYICHVVLSAYVVWSETHLSMYNLISSNISVSLRSSVVYFRSSAIQNYIFWFTILYLSGMPCEGYVP